MQLKADNLACNRGGREVFAGLSFSLSGGEALVVTGRNGAGKSSLLRVIAGLVRAAGGRLQLDGGGHEATIGEQSHYVGHQDAVKPSLTVHENLKFWAQYFGAGGAAIEAGAGSGRPHAARRPAGGLFVGRATAAAVDCAAGRGAAAALAAGRADLGARCAVARPARRLDAPPSRRRRHDRGGGARTDRTRTRARTENGAGMSAFIALVVRDMRLAIRVGGGALMGALFFLIVVTMMPFALGPDLALLARIGPAILWLGALLASLLALDRLFATDYDDGSLDLLMMGRMPLELAVAAKALAHWLTTALPLVVITPVLGLMLNIELRAMGTLALTLFAGTPALTFIGLIGAALSVALRRGGLLLAVLVLPLTIPVLIFGVAAANAAIVGPAPFGPPFTILCALSLASLVLGPVFAAAALRHGLE